MEEIAKALFGTILSNYGIVGLLTLMLFCAFLYGIYYLLKKVFDTQDKMIENQREAWSKGFEGMTSAANRQAEAMAGIEKILTKLDMWTEAVGKEHGSISRDIQEQRLIMDKIEERLHDLEDHIKDLESNIKDKQTGIFSYEEIEVIRKLLEETINEVRSCNDKTTEKIIRKLRHLEEIVNQKNISVKEINEQIEEIKDAVKDSAAQYNTRLTA